MIRLQLRLSPDADSIKFTVEVSDEDVRSASESVMRDGTVHFEDYAYALAEIIAERVYSDGASVENDLQAQLLLERAFGKCRVMHDCTPERHDDHAALHERRVREGYA